MKNRVTVYAYCLIILSVALGFMAEIFYIDSWKQEVPYFEGQLDYATIQQVKNGADFKSVRNSLSDRLTNPLNHRLTSISTSE